MLDQFYQLGYRRPLGLMEPGGIVPGGTTTRVGCTAAGATAGALAAFTAAQKGRFPLKLQAV